MTLHANADLGYVEVAGTAVLRKTVPQCRTCSHPKRDEIEVLLLGGRSPWAIANAVGPDGITSENIKEHFSRGHVALPVEAAQARLGPVAPTPLSGAMEAVVEPLSVQMGLLDAVVRRVAKRVDAGELEPTVPDAIKAAEVLARLEEAKAPQWHPDEVRATIEAISDAAQSIMTLDQWIEFQRAVARQPVIRAIKARSESQARAAAMAS